MIPASECMQSRHGIGRGLNVEECFLDAMSECLSANTNRGGSLYSLMIMASFVGRDVVKLSIPGDEVAQVIDNVVVDFCHARHSTSRCNSPIALGPRRIQYFVL